ncbi:FecR domain-containing protein [Halopseudomonas oceani]|uniref:FecR family protein n=1 Tax=Halopseudomonas oceani TaxID=1708783 RepID=UPI002AA6C333|nr:FecR domain-containing protein [Halopseudomonas oceani]
MTEPYAKDSPDAAAADWLLRQQQAPDDPALHAELQKWLQQDPNHWRSWQRAQQVWQLTASLAPLPQPGHSRQRRWRYPSALAASVLLAIVISQNLVHKHPQYHSDSQPEQITLTDGTRVFLDAGTELDVSMADDSRQLELHKGRVFLQVSPDASRPFQVSTDDLTVTVTGTAFLVDTDTRRNAVQVREGQVRVVHPDGPEVTLNAGQQLAANQCRHNCVSTVDSTQIAEWQSGYLTVQDQPLTSVLAELGRYQSGYLWLRSPELGQKRVTGRFKLDTPDAALRAVLGPYNARINSVSPWLTIISD